MNAPAIQGQVVAIHGVVKVIDAQGHERILKAGDIIQPGEHVVLLDGATLTVSRAGGDSITVDGPRDLALTDETLTPQSTDKSEAAVAKLAPEAQQVLAALENGQDPLAQLDSAAAGLNAGGATDEGSHGFVRLMRISETLNSLSLDSNATTEVLVPTVQGDTFSTTPVQAVAAATPISVSIDNISATNNATPTIHGTGIPGLTVVVSNAAGTVIGSAVVGSDGNWNLTPSSPLPDGTDTLIATSTNAAGSSASATGTAIIDTTPPATPTVTITEHNDPNGVIGAGDLVNGKVEATVKLDAADLAKNGSATIVVNDGGHITTLVVHSDGSVTGADGTVSGSYSNGTVTISMTPPAQDAAVTITATQTDGVGNTSGQGNDSGKLDTVAPSAPTVSIATDTNHDGFINKTEQGSSTTDTVNIGLPSDAKAGDTLNVTINGVAQPGHVLTAAEITAGQVVLTPAAPADGATLTVTATITDPAGNTSASGSSTAQLDLSATITIGNDGSGGDHIYNKAESTAVVVSGSTGSVEAGQTVTVTFTDSQGHTATTTATVDGNGNWTANPANLSGLTDGSISVSASVSDKAGNTATANTDTGSGQPGEGLDTTAPSAPTVVIATDANNDGFINKAEQGSATTDTVNIGLPADAKAGDTLNVTLNGVAQPGHVLTAAEITAGQVVLTPTAPAEGGTLTVAATITDVAGNTSASASDSAKLDTTAPSAPTVVIATDANNDGFINKAEQGSATTDTVNIGLPADAKAGDTLNVTLNGVAQPGHVLTAAEITAGQVVLTPAAPADGATLTVTATITDPAGNTSASGSSTAQLDLSATITIGNDGSGGDHIYNKAESTAVVVSGSTGSVEAGQTVTVTFTDSQGHTATTTATVDGNGNWTANPANLSGLTDGSISVSASVSDKAGNTATANTDTGSGQPGESLNTAASISIGTDGAGNDHVYNKTESGDVVVSGSTSGVEAGQTVTVTFTDSQGHTASTTATVDGSGNWTASSANLSGLVDGSVTVKADVTSVAGNSASASISDSKDTTATITIGNDGSGGDHVYNKAESGAVVISGSTGSVEAGQTVTVTFTDSQGHTATTTATVDGNGNWTANPANLSGLTDGSISVSASVSDKAGNTATANTDTGSGQPGESLNTAASISIGTNGAGNDHVYNKTESGDVVVSGSTSGVEAGQTVTVTFTDSQGHTASTTATVDGSGNWTASSANLSG
ncbi:retention module-containing protein, partial [Aquitalea aquatica]